MTNKQQSAGAQPRQAKLHMLDEMVSDLIADNDAALDAIKTGHPRGPQTGIEVLDKALGGFLETGLHILQATPGAGKTALALQIASDCGFPALYVSAEMPVLELFRRLIARQTSTFLGKLKGDLSSKNLEDLARVTAGKLKHLAIMDATSGVAEADFIRLTVENMKATYQAKTAIVLLDSLHVWARALLRGMSGEFEIISEGTRQATELAAILDSPIMAICHRNREGNKNKQGGGLHSSRGSGDIEYEAWTVLDLHRDMEQREDASGEIDVTMRFYKNRSNGITPPIETKFCGRLQSFRGLE
jgi:replicative DNA helicase